FVVFDSRRRVLFGARDRLGIKPFYYYTDAKQFVCASEVKAILTAPDVRCRVDPLAIGDYFFSGFPLSRRSMFEGISQLQPGHSLTVHKGVVTVQKYWDVEYAYDHRRSDEATTARLSELL